MPYKDKEKGKERHKQWRIENRDKVLENKKRFYRKNPEKHMLWAKNNTDKTKKNNRNSVLKRRYGISLEKYNEMFEDQNGCCAICGKHQIELKTTLNVDHNHDTGLIRKLLCWNCNTILGKINDDISILKIMIDYLEMYK